mmetsp:Transcript_2892/g.8423  ORF Transcript_2892/g.8423 Transcript_2892/m.8423 type:complete len:274 (+) Transcript_2892:132-953(+)
MARAVAARWCCRHAPARDHVPGARGGARGGAVRPSRGTGRGEQPAGGLAPRGRAEPSALRQLVLLLRRSAQQPASQPASRTAKGRDGGVHARRSREDSRPLRRTAGCDGARQWPASHPRRRSGSQWRARGSLCCACSRGRAHLSFCGRHARPPARRQGPGAQGHLDRLSAPPASQPARARARELADPLDEATVRQAAGRALRAVVRLVDSVGRPPRPRAVETEAGGHVPHVGAAVALRRARPRAGLPRLPRRHRRLLCRGPVPAAPLAAAPPV